MRWRVRTSSLRWPMQRRRWLRRKAGRSISSSDDEVFKHARTARLTLVTRDVGFGNIAKFPLGTHSGVVLVRLPTAMPARTVTETIVRAVADLPEADLTGNLVVVGPARVRLRRPK